jgi:hypothetical protein
MDQRPTDEQISQQLVNLHRQVQHWQHMALFLTAEFLREKGTIRERLIVTAESKEFPLVFNDVQALNVDIKSAFIMKVGHLFGEDPPTLLTIQKPHGLGFMLVPLSKAQELAEAAKDRLQIPDQGIVQ